MDEETNKNLKLRATKRVSQGNFIFDDRVKGYATKKLGKKGPYITVALKTVKPISEGAWINVIVNGI